MGGSVVQLGNAASASPSAVNAHNHGQQGAESNAEPEAGADQRAQPHKTVGSGARLLRGGQLEEAVGHSALGFHLCSTVRLEVRSVQEPSRVPRHGLLCDHG